MILRISVVVGCLVGMFTIIGGLVAFDNRYTKHVDHVQAQEVMSEQLEQERQARIHLTQRFEQELDMDKLFRLQDRMWRLEAQYGEAEAKKLDEYKRLKQDWKLLDKKLQ